MQSVACIAQSDMTVLNAVTYGTARNYSDFSSGGGKVASGLVYRVPTWMQTYDSMLADGFMDQYGAAYISYQVSAPAAESYKISPKFEVGGNALSGKYFFVVSVNDTDFYRYDVNGPGTYSPEFTVSLTKGRNLIRCIARIKDTSDVICDGVWVNQYELKTDSRLIGILPQKDLSLYPNDAAYKNYKQEGTSSAVGGCGECLGNVYERNITPESLKIGDIHLVPHFSFTVNVPEDGFYDMALRAYTGSVGGTGRYMIFVDDKKSIRKFYDYSKREYLSAGLYLPAGTHNITVTSVYNWTSADGSQSEVYRTWCNYYELLFCGGQVSLSSVQNDPSLCADASRLEAETYGIQIRTDKQYYDMPNCSGKKTAGAFSIDYSKVQTAESTKTYYDKSNTSGVSFMLDVEKAGTYTIKPGYYKSALRDGYAMTVTVNNKSVTTVPFVDANNSSGWNVGTVDLELDEGINTVRFSIVTRENGSFISEGYVAFDYIDIPSGVTGVLPNATRLEAEKSEYFYRYYESSDGLVRDFPDLAKAANITIDTVTIDNMPKVPGFAYTVEVPKNGYYNIDAHFRSEYIWSETPYNFVLFVDGQKYIKPHARFTGNTYSYDDNNADLSVYLTAGTHILTLTTNLPSEAGGNYYWNDFDCMVVYGGMKAADVQQSPTTRKYEAESAYCHNYSTVYNKWETYSGDAFVGEPTTFVYQPFNSLTTSFNPETAYTVFTVNAEKAGTYTMKLRYKFLDGDCTEEAGSAEYNAYVAKYGEHPYAAVVVNNETAYKFYHPTYYGWISDSDEVQVTLKEGVNTLMAVSPTAEVAKEFKKPYFLFDALIMQSGLEIANPNYYALGDANKDGRINIKDLLRVKRYISNSVSDIDLTAVNFDRDVNYNVSAGDLVSMKKMLLQMGDASQMPLYLPQQPIDNTSVTPDGNVSVYNPAVYWSSYNWYNNGSSKISAPGGAYFRIAFTGSTLGVNVDAGALGIINSDDIQMDCYFDGSQSYTKKSLSDCDMNGNIYFSTSLSSGKHSAVVYFSYTSQSYDRWSAPLPNALRMLGIRLAPGAQICSLEGTANQPKAKRVLMYGDSITEGVWIGESEYGYAPVLARKLGVEYSQCGYGWIGWSHFGSGCTDHFYYMNSERGMWKNYYRGHSRLNDVNDPSKGYIDGAPDAVFITLGHNDLGNTGEITQKVTAWLYDVRAAIGNDAQIFMILPFVTGKGTEQTNDLKNTLLAGIQNYLNGSGDSLVRTIDLGTFGSDTVTAHSPDDVHPDKTGAAMIGQRLYELVSPYFN